MNEKKYPRPNMHNKIIIIQDLKISAFVIDSSSPFSLRVFALSLLAKYHKNAAKTNAPLIIKSKKTENFIFYLKFEIPSFSHFKYSSALT